MSTRPLAYIEEDLRYLREALVNRDIENSQYRTAFYDIQSARYTYRQLQNRNFDTKRAREDFVDYNKYTQLGASRVRQERDGFPPTDQQKESKETMCACANHRGPCVSDCGCANYCSGTIDGRLNNLTLKKEATEREISFFNSLPEEPQAEDDDLIILVIEYTLEETAARSRGKRQHFYQMAVRFTVEGYSGYKWAVYDYAMARMDRTSWEQMITKYLYQPEYETTWWLATGWEDIFTHPPVTIPAADNDPEE